MFAGSRVLNRRIMISALAFLLTGCGNTSKATPAVAAPKEDFLRANMDLSVNPGEDFFAYANGAWLKAHPIPASEAGWGIGNVVREELYVSLRKINEDAAKADAAAGTDQQKIGDFWTTAMDEAKAERLGVDAAQGRARSDRRDQDRAGRARRRVRAAAARRQRVLRRLRRAGREEQRRDVRPPRRRTASACRIATTTSTRKRASRRRGRNTSATSAAC